MWVLLGVCFEFWRQLFFLPFGFVGEIEGDLGPDVHSELESDLYFLMFGEGLQYGDCMGMPYSRRRRFVDKRYTDIRAAQNKNANVPVSRRKR